MILIKKFYKVVFADNTSTSFYVNNLGGKFYAELKLNKWYIRKPKYLIETKEFEDTTLENILNRIKEFITESKPNIDFEFIEH